EMGRNRLSRTTLAVAVAGALLAPAAWAQDTTVQAPPETATRSDATTLGAVTVTARKREETIQDVPVAVTAFTAEALDRLAIKYISEGVPGEMEGFAEWAVGNHDQPDVKAAVGGPLAGNDALRARIAVASLNRDGFGENVYNDQPVSDKEILAMRAQLGAYVSDDLDIQFAFDWMDDQSGVRGAKMLAPNRFVPGFDPMDSRYDIRSGMPNVNDTTIGGASATVNWRASDDWAFKYVLVKRESDTETNIDFDTLPARIADVKAFYSDEQVSHELQANYD